MAKWVGGQLRGNVVVGVVIGAAVIIKAVIVIEVVIAIKDKKRRYIG